MGVSEKFLALVKVYAGTKIEFEHLKPITVAQWLLETGHGTSFLCKEHNNFGGMMFRAEMSNWPFPVGKVRYTSPSDNIDTFYATFASLGDWIKGYWKFIDRAVYSGWRDNCATSKEYIEWLKKCGYAADESYVKKVLALLPEATDLLSNVKDDTHSDGEGKVPKATWFEGYRVLDTNGQAETGVVAINGGTNVATWRGKDRHSMWAFMQNFPEATNFLIAPATKPWPGDMKPPAPPPPPPKPTPTGKKVLLDPGHSESHPGARGKNPSVQEEDLNRFQAAELKARLAEYGIAADIYDPDGDDLFAIGQKAQGYDAFVSLHLNAFKQREFYTCAMCHPGKQSPNGKSAQVASAWAQAVANAINNPCFGGTQGWPKGVMATGLSVLSGAATTNCPIFFLSEAEFVDDETEDGLIKVRLKKAMAAGAKVLAEALGV